MRAKCSPPNCPGFSPGCRREVCGGPTHTVRLEAAHGPKVGKGRPGETGGKSAKHKAFCTGEGVET